MDSREPLAIVFSPYEDRPSGLVLYKSHGQFIVHRFYEEDGKRTHYWGDYIGIAQYDSELKAREAAMGCFFQRCGETFGFDVVHPADGALEFDDHAAGG